MAPRLLALASALAEDVDKSFPGTTTIALDASFPFFDGFPVLPHVSHDDGRKLDLAFFYATPDGAYLRGVTRSPIGYWAFETPGPGEATECPPAFPTGRWDLDWLQPFLPNLPLESQRTRAALAFLFSDGPALGLDRVFLEPYLGPRLKIGSERLRFQGCRAARHDDHVDIQISG